MSIREKLHSIRALLEISRLRFTRTAQHKMRLLERLHIFLPWRFLGCSCIKPWAAWSDFRADPESSSRLDKRMLVVFPSKILYDPLIRLWQKHKRRFTSLSEMKAVHRSRIGTPQNKSALNAVAQWLCVVGKKQQMMTELSGTQIDTWMTTTRPYSESW